MIEVQGVTKRYGDTVAVNGLTFDVRPGNVTGFLGPNGSGKSTTMRLIMGLDYPDSGSIRIDGRRFRDLPRPLNKVGALLEARAIHPGRSASNHLLALAAANGIKRSRVEEVLQLVGLEKVARKRAGKFSLGMGQRLGIAAALLGDPEVLLFDEPINGLDPEGILWVRNLLHHLAGEGRTIFVSSHLMSEMALTADHVIVIGKGRMIANSSMADFLARNRRQAVRVRTPEPARLRQAIDEMGATVRVGHDGVLSVEGMTVEAVGDLAFSIGVPLHELSSSGASLEETFMDLTRGSLEYTDGSDLGSDGSRNDVLDDVVSS
ncbi:MAG: ATP-binding cassette domain-containing protein [Actinobacteria bacterium]|jgi:ABC-2 type transport system ATP-binding protein|nr:ATP-binding cassette domain-containing protein [Actinomycetota bacterium]